MRVAGFHEPPTGVDHDQVPLEKHAKKLRHHGGTVALLRFGNSEGDGGYEKETSHNTTKDAEDYHAVKEKKIRQSGNAAHAGKVDGDADDEPGDPDNE